MLFYEIFKLLRSFPTPYEQALVPTVRLYGIHPTLSYCYTYTGRNKLIINHLGKLFVTSDAATIIRELEVVHPAAKLLVMASQAQEAEVRASSFSCALPSFMTLF